MSTMIGGTIIFVAWAYQLALGIRTWHDADGQLRATRRWRRDSSRGHDLVMRGISARDDAMIAEGRRIEAEADEAYERSERQWKRSIEQPFWPW